MIRRLLSVLFSVLLLTIGCGGGGGDSGGGGDDTEQGLLEGAIYYQSSLPEAKSVTFTNSDGEEETVTAYAGLIQIFFNTSVTAAEADEIIRGLGGTVVGQIPDIGYYLVQVSEGAEAAFITNAAMESSVRLVIPDIAAEVADAVPIDDSWWQTDRPVPLNIPVGGIIIDAGSHGQVVAGAFVSRGGTVGTILSAMDANGRISNHQIINAITAAAAGRDVFTPEEPTLINLSIQGGGNSCDWGAGCGDTPLTESARYNGWERFSEAILTGIAGLPAEYRENMLMTWALGNGSADVSALITQLRLDTTLSGIIDNNIIYAEANDMIPVSTTRPSGTYSNTATDDAVITYTGETTDSDGNVHYGTSYTASHLLAFAQQLIANSGCSTVEAKLAVNMAITANSSHEFVMAEAEDKLYYIQQAEETDSPNAFLVTGIEFTSVGSNTSAVITPQYSGVSVAYTVSGTDGYYDSGTLQTNAGGSVSFFIPSGASGVTDTISASVLLKGLTVRTTYTW